eukprot:592239-Rhodomonas_salina.3
MSTDSDPDVSRRKKERQYPPQDCAMAGLPEEKLHATPGTSRTWWMPWKHPPSAYSEISAIPGSLLSGRFLAGSPTHCPSILETVKHPRERSRDM